MSDSHKREILRRAAERASTDDFFVANDLASFRAIHGSTDEQLAEFLGCSQPALSLLGLCRRPDPSSSRFRADVEQIAAYVGVSAEQLARLFREVDGIQALRAAQRRPSRTPDRGLLMAARDAPQENQPEEAGGGEDKVSQDRIGEDTNDEEPEDGSE